MADKTSDRRWIIWLRNGALLVLVAAFIPFFVGGPGGDGGPDVVAEVGGEPVSRDALEFLRESIAQREAANLPEGGDRRAIEQMLTEFAREQALQLWVFSGEARRLGLAVSDREVGTDIREDRSFQGEGRFDREGYERWAARMFQSPRAYEEFRRRQLGTMKLFRLLQSPLRVAEVDVRDAVEREQTTIALRYARAGAAELRTGVTVTPEEARAFAGANRERVAAVYENRKFEFQQDEAVHARHALFKGETAGVRATQALARIRAGEDFEKIARELSEDPATRDAGGDLGFVERGSMQEAFEAAAFALEPGQVSEPVETDRGTHLIQVVEKRAGGGKTLEEVQDRLAEEILRDERAREAARAKAEAMAERLRAGEDFAKAAQAAGLEVLETTPFRWTSALVPGIGRVPRLREAAFALTSEKRVSFEIFGSGETYYLIALKERQEPDADAIAAALGPARERLEEQARAQHQMRWYKTRREALERDGALRLYALDREG
jgi:peptidyl-prolyl cis-trans isomerase D